MQRLCNRAHAQAAEGDRVERPDGILLGLGAFGAVDLERTGHQHQRRDPLLDRRMGGEQAREPRLLRRIVQEHAAQLVRRLELRLARHLAQGRDHGVRVLGQLHRPGVGHIFPRPRQGHADDGGQAEADHADGQSDQDQRHGVLVVPAAAAAHIEQAAEHQFGHHADDPCEDRGDHHGPHVLVDDVGQLMRQDALHLVAVQGLHQAARDGDAVVALVQAGRIGVQRRAFDDAQGGRLHPARDRQVLQQIVEVRLDPALDLSRSGHDVDHHLIAEIGDDEPDRRRDGGEGHGPAQHGRRQRQILPQIAARVGQKAEPHHQHLNAEQYADQQHREPGQQDR